MSDSATHRELNAVCDEALRLGRILAELVPKEPEVHGLVALMEIHTSRAQARGEREREFLMKRAESCALRSSAAQ